MTEVVETEVDIMVIFYLQKNVKANPSSFTQKAELAMTIKIILGPIQIKPCVVNEWFSNGHRSFLRGKLRKQVKDFFNSLKNDQMELE